MGLSYHGDLMFTVSPLPGGSNSFGLIVRPVEFLGMLMTSEGRTAQVDRKSRVWWYGHLAVRPSGSRFSHVHLGGDLGADALERFYLWAGLGTPQERHGRASSLKLPTPNPDLEEETNRWPPQSDFSVSLMSDKASWSFGGTSPGSSSSRACSHTRARRCSPFTC